MTAPAREMRPATQTEPDILFGVGVPRFAEVDETVSITEVQERTGVEASVEC
jgi:hypothetical protein